MTVFLNPNYMSEIFHKGFVIGILLSAPIGPMGMLIIQRTLYRNRKHGFATALGVITSDIIYSLITLLGIGLLIDFLDVNKTYVQIFGGLVLLVLGYYIYRTNPIKHSLEEIEQMETEYVKDYLKGFAMTLPNFAILLYMITLFANFQFNPVKHGHRGFVLGLFSITLGEVLWWLGITILVSQLRKFFNRTVLKWLNRIVGSVLMIAGLVGVTMSLFSLFAV